MSNTRIVYCVINWQSDCSDCRILIQTFYLAWWFCPASSDRTLGAQVVSLSLGRKGSFSQTGTSMCHRPIKPPTLRKSGTTSWRQIFTSHNSSDAALLMGLLIRRWVPKVCRRRGQECDMSHLLVMTSSKDKVVKDPFFLVVMHRSQWCCLSWKSSSQKEKHWVNTGCDAVLFILAFWFLSVVSLPQHYFHQHHTEARSSCIVCPGAER